MKDKEPRKQSEPIRQSVPDHGKEEGFEATASEHVPESKPVFGGIRIPRHIIREVEAELRKERGDSPKH